MHQIKNTLGLTVLADTLPEIKWNDFGDVNWREYGGFWVSDAINAPLFNDDSKMFLVVQFDRDPDDEEEAYAWVSIVSLEAVTPEMLLRACDGEIPDNEPFAAYLLYQNVGGAHVASFHETVGGDDDACERLVNRAKEEAVAASFLTGFYLDRQANVLGATGWDFLAGNPLGPLGEK